MTKLLPKAEIERHAHESGAVRRRRKVDASAILWSVLLGFGTGRELMVEFYARYGAEGGNAGALAGAQRAMIRRDYGPGHWAGFVVSEWTGRAS